MTQINTATRTFAIAFAALVSTASWVSTISNPAGMTQDHAAVAAAIPPASDRTA